MSDRIRVNVFVQAYNTAAYVGECLESILTQRGVADFDVVVIDDASTDATAREIARFQSDRRVQVVRHERNCGAIATANEGYARGSAPFVIRVDSDDRLRPDFLSRMLPLFETYPDVGMAYSDVATIDSRGETGCAKGVVERLDTPAYGNELLPLLMKNYIPAPATLLRREALAPLLPIPASFRFLDWYLTTGVADGWNSYFVDEVLADYRVHDGNMHRAMILDGQGEATSLEILDRVFQRPHRQPEKRRWRRRVYASCYLTYAEKYFGAGMSAEARRCYAQAAVRQPSILLKTDIARHLVGALMGRRLYDSLKWKVRPTATRPSSIAS